VSTVVVFHPDVERVLSLKTVRSPEALAQFLSAIEAAGREDEQFSAERLRELLALGEHFQALLLYDQVDFLRASGVSERDREFATGVQRVDLAAANGYQRFLRTRESWATTPEAREDAHRLAGLALDAIHGLMKWGYFLGEPARGAPWQQLHALYRLADADGSVRAPFVLHPAQPAFKPSVQSLYLRTLVLDFLNAGNLSRAQIEIADGWFSSWCEDYSLEPQYVQGRHHFYVDFDSAAGLRLMRGDSPGDSARFLRADAIKAQIEEVQDGLRHGRLFAGYGAGALFPVEEHAALLATIEKLHQSVLSGNEARVEERTHFEDREVDVVTGADRVFRKVRIGATGATAAGSQATYEATQTIEITPAGLSLVPGVGAAAVAPEVDPDIQRWRVQDLSSRGYGLIVDHEAAEVLAVGDLIALLNHETGGWIVGNIVRKRPARVRGEVLAGVEVLSYRPIAVDLLSVSRGEAVEAVFLAGGDSSGKHDSLLVRGTNFDSGRTLALKTPEGEFRLRLNRIVRKGVDWLNARFEIESKKG
jgi:cyclic-di-GMP-binding protein